MKALFLKNNLSATKTLFTTLFMLLVVGIFMAQAAGFIATGSLTYARAGHTATLLPNGKVLVTGGECMDGGTNIQLSSSEIYDPAAGTWTETGSLTKGREYHTATLLVNGKVLVAGGFNYWYSPSFPNQTTAEIYDPATGTWTATGSLAKGRRKHTATLLPDGKVLVVGGGE